MSYQGAVKALSAAIAAIGVAVLVATFLAGGGPRSGGFLLGLAFLGVGIGRFWIARRMER